MAERGTVIGWKLAAAAREQLLQRFEPKYDKVVADHVTLSTGATPATQLPPHVRAQVIGRADDDVSLECLVVEIDGTTDRPDGSIYHITWSLGPGRRARESNDVLRDRGWDQLSSPILIELEPARF